jgi:peptide/nickel transport system permease protein
VGAHLGRFLFKRFISSLITLWLLATVLFVIVNVLPGNPGRRILGPQAPEESVKEYNKKFGVDRPLVAQYGTSMKRLVTLDFGESFRTGKSVVSVVRPALFRSAKLAVLALVITIPLSIAAGIFAARRQNRFGDRFVVMTGLATTSIPDFVVAAFLLSVFCVTWKIGKVFANPPSGASVVGQFRYLIFPSLALVVLYFGYIARMTRAGVINALQADYVRTATMKGLSSSKVMRSHILRNALAPTITVVSVQTGYLFGSIIGVERVFNYSGIGSTILDSVGKKDIPVLQGAVLIIGIIYMLSTLAADLLIAFLNPRVRLDGST